MSRSFFFNLESFFFIFLFSLSRLCFFLSLDTVVAGLLGELLLGALLLIALLFGELLLGSLLLGHKYLLLLNDFG